MQLQTQRVLIVDDEYVPRSLEALALEGTGRYNAVVTSNAADALTELSSASCDCAVIDMAMPDMDGLDLVKHIRQGTASRDLPIMLVLPEDMGPEEVLSHYPGVNDVISKPFDPWDLARRIDALVGTAGETGPRLSVEAVLRGFPYPTMIMDSNHQVILGNGPFYQATNAGIGSCFVHCHDHMHEDGGIPAMCPLRECVSTGKAAERVIETVMGDMRVSVYPLESGMGEYDRLFLHITQPVSG